LHSMLLILVIAGIQACTGPRKVNVQKKGRLADIYNPSRITLHPDFSLFHVNDNESVAYIRIIPAELLFNQANEQGEFLASLKIWYEVREIISESGNTTFTDSSTISKTLNKKEIRNSFFTAIPLNAVYGKKYIIRVDIEDVLRRSVSRNFLLLDKTSEYNEQNFKVLSASQGYPVFDNNFRSTEAFRISYHRFGADSLTVNYFALDRTLPRPIFSSAPEIPMRTFPDSVYRIPYHDTLSYTLKKTGIYHIKAISDVEEGLTLFNFGENFPRIKTTEELLGPLVYLTSSAEFRDLRMQPNRKLAIDNFWLEAAGSIEAARELIRVFYKRVLFSNLYFTSYKEGWKTDRGMIYIIFGPPGMLNKEVNLETWTYFTKRNNAPIEFLFKRRENLFTNDDFKLQRSMSSTSLWSEAVQSWRKGKIYSPEY